MERYGGGGQLRVAGAARDGDDGRGGRRRERREAPDLISDMKDLN
jgi:hypothetical protein